MEKDISLKADVELGVVPTHARFVGGLLPDENGLLPRNDRGEFVVVAAMRELIDRSRVVIDSTQISIFPGTLKDEYPDLIGALRELGLGIHLVIMVGGVDPIDPDDEEEMIAQLIPSLTVAKEQGVASLSSTSIEQWMQPGGVRRDGGELEAAIEQTVKVHLRAYREAGLEDSSIEAWHIEFLRPGEFQTFTDLGRLWTWVSRANEQLGKSFFRCLVDAAHCGDSGLDIPENVKLIQEVADGGGLGIMHASAKTTRGCLSTDDGWIAALLAAAARTGKLKQVFVEMFHHDDDALAPLRELVPGHGVDTRDGRDYTQVVADGLETVTRLLNNHVARGNLGKR